MRHSIDYGSLMHRAMRGLIQEVLERVQREGLPGNHHFFITFDTLHPDVELADWLSDRYPGDMTIVIQHWFDKLEVTDDGFAITLNFGNQPEPLYVPFDAIKTFVDPSVEFGLRFESQDSSDEEDEDDIEDEDDEAPMDEMVEPDAAPKRGEAEVVSLDKFRK
ncbi:ClpXP protease specificity-enhancing factor SspB [Loktanella sp. IMCC34160]|uniref:SspB family protein n=1 Tax=Loktanella sp. IMCC34160 TaxID=2510646 RepID=UPI001F5CA92F|nr:ClpXP protease specificity-enhancing factor SspB [Loktanella sp. IMCC34160]